MISGLKILISIVQKAYLNIANEERPNVMVDTLLLLIFTIFIVLMFWKMSSLYENVNVLQNYIDVLCDKIDKLGTDLDKMHAHIGRMEDDFDQLKAYQDAKEQDGRTET